MRGMGYRCQRRSGVEWEWVEWVYGKGGAGYEERFGAG